MTVFPYAEVSATLSRSMCFYAVVSFPVDLNDPDFHWKINQLIRSNCRPSGPQTLIRHIDGTKRYILKAVDRHSRFVFARMYTSHNSVTTADFLRKFDGLVNGPMMHRQTDNGSEFKRTLQKEFIELWSAYSHVDTFNRKLSD